MTAFLGPSRSMIREFTKHYSLISLIPVTAFLVIAITGGYLTQRHITALLRQATHELNTDAKAELEALGRTIIQNKARDAANQVAIFLSFNGQAHMEDLQRSPYFQQIAMQQVGRTGYVCMYEAGSGVMRVHPNATLVDKEMAFLADELPSWWTIFERSLSGDEVSGYYDWIEPDGSVRKKYMTMTPVETPFRGKTLMVAATTYIDEFSASVAAMERKAETINAGFHHFLSTRALLSALIMAIFLSVTFWCVYLIGRKAALYYMLPIAVLARTAERFGEGRWNADLQPALTDRKDEIGVLARSFESMRRQLQKLFGDLESRVSELNQAQQSLKESEQHFRSLFDGVPVGLYRTTMDGSIIDANSTLVTMLGYSSKNDFLSRRAEEVYAVPGDRSKWKTKIEESAADHVHEVRMRRYDQSEIWVENHSRATRDENHAIVHVEGSLIDITERKQAEAALRESEERYRTLTELLPIGIFEADDRGVLTFANRAALQLIGFDRADCEAGLTISALVAPAYRDKALKHVEKILNGAVGEGAEYLIRRKDRSTCHAFINARSSNDRTKPGMIGYLFDLTKLKQAEKALRESEEKLARSRKMESLGLLAGGVAHDLNNILSGIATYPELLLMDMLPDSDLRKPIEIIKESGNRAAAIVQDLLTVARGVATMKEPLNLNDLVADYFDSPEFEKLKQFHPTVSIHSNLASDLLLIRASAVHLRKVVMNLVSNAAEAIQGDGVVTVSTANRHVDTPLRGDGHVIAGEYVVLSVSDTGSGISTEDLERIFEPFYTKKVMGRSGTGLGLAVVWNTVQDHNGHIDVSSSETGTTFAVYFPITREETSPHDLAVPVDAYRGNGETILVVDDVASQREISCQLLTRLGYRTEAVASGEEAVHFLTKQPVDLILLDMIMEPGMSGREAYERIVRIHPDQKAVIASGFAETDDVKALQKMGAGRFIRKPFTVETLGLAVREALAGRPVGSSSHSA